MSIASLFIYPLLPSETRSFSLATQEDEEDWVKWEQMVPQDFKTLFLCSLQIYLKEHSVLRIADRLE